MSPGDLCPACGWVFSLGMNDCYEYECLRFADLEPVARAGGHAEHGEPVA